MAYCPYCGTPSDPINAFCIHCGALLPTVPAPVVPSVLPAPFPPSYAPPAGRPSLAFLAILVFVVAALLVTAAIAWVVISPQAPPLGVTRPTVVLGSAFYSGSSILISVSYISSGLSPSYFALGLQVGGYGGGTVSMPTTSGYGGGVILSAGGYSFYTYWTDYDNNGELSTGDLFTLDSLGGTLPFNTTATFLLLWSDGSVLSQTTFGAPTNTIPSATLDGAYRSSNTSVLVGVQSVNPAYPASYFRIELAVDNTSSGSYPLPPVGYAPVNVTVGPSEYPIIWYDLGSNGLLDGGDAFNISLAGGAWPSSGTMMGFLLEWTDGSVLASVYWSA